MGDTVLSRFTCINKNDIQYLPQNQFAVFSRLNFKSATEWLKLF